MRTDDRITRMVSAACVALASAVLMGTGLTAQGVGVSTPFGSGPGADLKQQIERRFTVLPIVDGIVLTPRTAGGGKSAIKSIELSRGTISVDGVPVTGAELRAKLGADADSILQASYLSAGDQRALADMPAGTDPSAVPPPPPPPLPPSPSLTESPQSDVDLPGRERGGDIIHIGRDVRVEANDVVHGSAVSIGQSVTVLGEVRGDVAAIGGDVDLGPHAVVSGKVAAIGGRLHKDPGARIGGEVEEWSTGRFNDMFRRTWQGSPRRSSFAAPLALVAQITRVFVLCLLAMLVVLVGGNFVERVGSRAAAEPLKAGAVGFLAQILFLPLLIVTILLLVVTIIGIPLLVLIPFVILGLVLVALVGFTAVAGRVGRLVAEKLSWTGGPYLLTVAGILLLLIPVLFARVIGLGGFPLTWLAVFLTVIGGLVEYVAWTVGFGAVVLMRFSKAPA